MKQISSGKYTKRLNLRDDDESNVKSFFLEVNKLLGNMEKMHQNNNILYNDINNLLKDLNKVMDGSSDSNPIITSNDDIKKSIANLEKRLKEFSAESKSEEETI
ncbi:MAG: hypothetical protein HQK93_03250 [Nitrospirae bacterium]|nr:hypothetical protein [Nitrospirota bacterium]